MNKSLVTAVFAVVLSAPLAALADEFDITMDVVGAEESFDEVIVNRIALPFSRNEDNERLKNRGDKGLAAEVVGDVVDIVDERLAGSEIGDDMPLDSVESLDQLDSMLDVQTSTPDLRALSE